MVFSLSQITNAFSYTLEVSDRELQSKISAAMPYKKRKYLITVVLSNPSIELNPEKNEIAVSTHIEVMAPGGIYETGEVQISGSVSYKPEETAFYFDNATIRKMALKRLSNKLIPQVKKITQYAVTKFSKKRPIYTLKQNTIKHKLAKSTLKSVCVNEGKLLLTFNPF